MGDPVPAGGVRTGAVEEFDEQVGLGVVRGDDGATLAFHCTAISDGTRRIEPGTRVAYVAVAAHRGAVEARPVTPLSGRPDDAGS